MNCSHEIEYSGDDELLRRENNSGDDELLSSSQAGDKIIAGTMNSFYKTEVSCCHRPLDCIIGRSCQSFVDLIK
jgi:hypothetical protein